jgi:heat shock protein HtpX
VPISAVLALLVALAPAIVSWWTGRGILARADDPALPELLLERRRRMNQIALGGAVALGVLAGSALLWALPLLGVALLVAGYPLRRSLFAEQWSLPAFLRYAISSWLGQAGWQLFAVVGPLIVIGVTLGSEPDTPREAVRLALWIGGYFAVVAIVWQHFYARVWLDLHRATLLRAGARPELVARLDAVLDRAALRRRPEIYRFGAPGGHFVNALAIPSLTHSAVALSDGLLAMLTDDEIVGVFAHEVAHHEQFTRRRLWGGRIAGVLLALLNVALPLSLIRLGPLPTAVGAIAYYLVIFGTLGKSAGRGKRRRHETESDLRAAALTGNAEAVASALTKVHLSNRVPRRWPHAMETAATHPSLARRIQALRGAACHRQIVAWQHRRRARGGTGPLVRERAARYRDGARRAPCRRLQLSRGGVRRSHRAADRRGW